MRDERLDPYEWAFIALNTPDAGRAWQEVERRLHRAGFDKPVYLFNLRLRPADAYPDCSQKLGTMLSRDWEAFCLENSEMVVDDPVRNRLPASEEPFHYATDRPDALRCTEAESRVMGIYRDHGLLAASHYPVHDRERNVLSALCLGETRDARGFHELNRVSAVSLRLAAAHFTEGLTVRQLHESRERPRLSAREADCLAWASAGLSSKRIADRLRLSEATVNEYFASAIRKLGASNRAHACARALLLSMISP